MRKDVKVAREGRALAGGELSLARRVDEDSLTRREMHARSEFIDGTTTGLFFNTCTRAALARKSVHGKFARAQRM